MYIPNWAIIILGIILLDYFLQLRNVKIMGKEIDWLRSVLLPYLREDEKKENERKIEEMERKMFGIMSLKKNIKK